MSIKSIAAVVLAMLGASFTFTSQAQNIAQVADDVS